MWFQESVFYQIYPLGFCGAERQNDFQTRHDRLGLVAAHVPRLQELGVGAVLFNPVFQSETHGYDGVRFFDVDNRLGTNEDFAALVKAFHEAGIRVVLDGVFNHVGRSFDKFKDVRQNRAASRYKDWFCIDFSRDSAYNDGFWYEGWEGHFNLVKLNLHNEEVRQFLFDAARRMIDFYDIDGLRLDVGYMLPEAFIRDMSAVCKQKKDDFFIVAEAIHGDYNRLLNNGADSVTNYECYKGLHSAINSRNLFEIEHSLTRQFADTQWALYKGRHLLNFVDNHDVTRAYTILKDKRDALCLYAILFAMPGIPCLYYGSEYGCEGGKGDCDVHLRAPMAEIDAQAHPELTAAIRAMALLRRERKSLCYGGYGKVVLNNEYFCIARTLGQEKTLLLVNISDAPVRMNCGCETPVDLLTGEKCDACVTMPPHAFRLLDGGAQ